MRYFSRSGKSQALVLVRTELDIEGKMAPPVARRPRPKVRRSGGIRWWGQWSTGRYRPLILGSSSHSRAAAVTGIPAFTPTETIFAGARAVIRKSGTISHI